MVYFRYFILTCLIVFGNRLNAQQGILKAEIESSLKSSWDNNDLLDYIVYFKEQPDVSEAYLMHSKSEKAWHVYSVCNALAAKTQRKVWDLLKEKNIYFNPLFIVNAIHVKSDKKILLELAQFEEVQSIMKNPSFYVPEPEYIKQDNYELTSRLNVPAWGITKIGADQVWTLGYFGQDVVIGGQDTGYKWDVVPNKEKYRGYDIGSGLADHNFNWHDGVHSIDVHNSGSNPCGLNLVEPCDDHGHGTHTMGTMVGNVDNNGDQIGVAPAAKWIGCRNMERGWGTPATYTECFQWFIAPTDLSNSNPNVFLSPDVINNSWGCPPDEGCNSSAISMMLSVVNNVRAAGIVPIVSAGNSGPNCSTISDPAAIFASSFTIGASSSSDAIASFSSRGPVSSDGSGRMKPDVVAPGVGVRSVLPDGTFANWNGTSMAGPHVAGAVALIINANPSLAGNVDTILGILKSTAITLTSTQNCTGPNSGNLIPNAVFGFGRIDVLSAVLKAQLTSFNLNIHNFRATAINDMAVLEWQISTQNSAIEFEIQRSQNGYSFEKINSGDPSVFKNSIDSYNFKEKLKPGLYYYRIRIKTRDGKIEYTRVVQLNIEGNQLTMDVFPNPFNNAFTMKFGGADHVLQVWITDVSGRIVFEQKNPILNQDQTFFVDFGNINPGVYFISAKDSRQTIVKKIISLK